MTVSNGDFLSFAEAVMKADGLTEIHHRNVVSRAYYGVYLSARHFQDKIPYHADCDKLGTHGKVTKQIERMIVGSPYGRDLTMEIKSIGYKLKQLCERRRKADYDLDETVIEEEAITQLNECKALLPRVVAAHVAIDQAMAAGATV